MAIIHIIHRNDNNPKDEIGVWIDADLETIAELKLSADEIVTENTEKLNSNMRWPTFGDEGEEYIFNFYNKDIVEKYKEIYKDKEEA